MLNDRVVVYLAHDPDEVGSPVTLDDKADEYFNYAVQIPRETLTGWQAALAAYDKAQQEMFALWKQQNDAAETRARREMEQEQVQLRAETAASAAEAVRLDAELGPREWLATRRKKSRDFTEVIVHKVSCSSAANATYTVIERHDMRLAEAVEFLRDIDRRKSTDLARPCGRCGKELAEALTIYPSKPNPAGNWF